MTRKALVLSAHHPGHALPKTQNGRGGWVFERFKGCIDILRVRHADVDVTTSQVCADDVIDLILMFFLEGELTGLIDIFLRQ